MSRLFVLLEKAGTHTETRIVRRKGKTFQQRFHVGRKEKSGPSWMSSTQHEACQAMWRQTSLHGREVGVFFTERGVSSFLEGDKTCIRAEMFEPHKEKLYKGEYTTLVHTHPKGGGGFSGQDLDFFARMKLRDMVVISDKVVYRMRKSDTPSPEFPTSKLPKALQINVAKYNQYVGGYLHTFYDNINWVSQLTNLALVYSIVKDKGGSLKNLAGKEVNVPVRDKQKRARVILESNKIVAEALGWELTVENL